MQRRQFLLRTAATLACAAQIRSLQGRAPAMQLHGAPPTCPAQCSALRPIDARVERITHVQVCTRPFRRAGPRIQAERLGHKLIVHNYGHGGAGWSLSWGSSAAALQIAKSAQADSRSLGVIGCGPLGLTSALLAQRAGMAVRIYAKAVPPGVPSMGAVGMWSPSSRFCEAPYVGSWMERWREMAQTSFESHLGMLALPNMPVEYFNGYYLLPDQVAPTQIKQREEEPEYAEFPDDFLPPLVGIPPGSHPFPAAQARCWTSLMFNITSYANTLMEDFLAAGGEIVVREFTRPHQLLALPEDTLINATGYGARALFADDTVVPVRGQTARLIAQPEVTYGLRAEQFLVVPRRDGLIIENVDETGFFNNDDDRPDYAAAEDVVRQVAAFVGRSRCS